MTTQYHLISPRSPPSLRKYIVEKFGLILFRMPEIQVFASALDLSKQALFYFPKSSSYLGRNPSLHPGEGGSLSRPPGQEDCCSPLSHSPPKIHLPMAVIKEKTKLAAMSSGNLGKYFQKTVEIDESASNRVQARPLRFAPTGKTAELSPLHEKIRTMCARAQGSDYFLRVIGDKKTDVSCRKRSI